MSERQGDQEAEAEGQEEETGTRDRTTDRTEDILKAVHLREQGHTIREIAGMLNLPKTKVGRWLRGQLPDAPQQPQGPPQYIEETVPPYEPQPNAIPQPAGVYLSPQALLNLRSMLSASQQRVFDGQVAVSSMAQQQGPQMNPYPYGYVDPFEVEMAKNLKLERYRRMMGHNNPGEDRRTDFLEKIVLEMVKEKKQGGGSGEASQLLQVLWNITSSMQASNLDLYDKMQERLSSLKGSSVSDEVALKLKELDIMFAKWDREQQMKAKLLGQVGQAIETSLPHIARGYAQGWRPKEGRSLPQRQTEVSCPKCHVSIPIGKQPPSRCPQCGEPLKLEGQETIQLACLECNRPVVIKYPWPDMVVCKNCGSKYRHAGRDEKGEVYDQVAEAREPSEEEE